MDSTTRMVSALLVVAGLTGCTFGPIETITEYQYGDSAWIDWDCPAGADQYPHSTSLLKTSTDPTVFEVSIGTSEVGTSSVMTITAPDEISTSPDEFAVVVSTYGECVEEGATTVGLAGRRADRVHKADYSACTFAGTKGTTDGIESVNYEFTICDENGDHPGTSPPPPPSGQAYAGSSTGPFPGPVWFQELQANGTSHCFVVRHQTPDGIVRSGVVEATSASLPGGGTRYSVVDSGWLGGLASGFVDIVPGAAGTVVVSGSTGTPEIDSRFGLAGAHTLAPVPTPGPAYPNGAEGYLNAICSTLLTQ